ncbi:MAG: carboxylesterase family protein, partial [Pseudomonadota bacterium]
RTGAADAPLNELLNLETTAGPVFDGARLAALGDVVVVTTNYRLAALGNLASPALAAESPLGISGNYGMFDLITALWWVQQEIYHFGGDPSRVTLFGQSAGAHNVGMLLASPLGAGLFSRAIMQSGVMQVDSADEARDDAQAFVEEMGIEGEADLPGALRALPLERIVLARTAAPRGYADFTFYPHVDGFLVDQQPLDRVFEGVHNDVPFIIGSNSEEYLHDFSDISIAQFEMLAAEMVPPHRLGELLALYPLEDYLDPAAAYAAMVTDRNLTSSVRTVARTFSTQHSPVYRYHFRRTLSTQARKAPGAYHASDLLYLFQHMDGREFDADEDDQAVSDLLLELWTAFARSGEPNAPGRPLWPEYDVSLDPYLILDVVPAQADGLERERSDFWDSVKLEQ